MLQEPTNLKRASAAHHERWSRAYGDALVRFVTEGRPSVNVLTDFVWDKGVLDLVAPLDFETRDALRKSGSGLPWNGRGEVELYWRLMYAVLAEITASVDTLVLDPMASRNPIRNVMDVSVALTDLVAERASALFRPGTSGPGVLQGLLEMAANQVRLRTGKRVPPKPISPFTRARVGEVVGLVMGYGHDGRILLDRETLPLPAQTREDLDWNQEPKRGRWQAWALPWLVEPAL